MLSEDSGHRSDSSRSLVCLSAPEGTGIVAPFSHFRGFAFSVPFSKPPPLVSKPPPPSHSTLFFFSGEASQ